MQVLVILVIMLLFFCGELTTIYRQTLKRKGQMACSSSHSFTGLASGGWSEALYPEHLLLYPFISSLYFFVMAPLAISQASLYASSSKSLSESRQAGRSDSLLGFFGCGSNSVPESCRLGGFAMRRQCSSSACQLKPQLELASSCDASRSCGSGRLLSSLSGANV